MLFFHLKNVALENLSFQLRIILLQHVQFHPCYFVRRECLIMEIKYLQCKVYNMQVIPFR